MKRFTDTEKWKDAWFAELSPSMKLLWIYLLDVADSAGVVDYSKRLADFDIGEAISIDEMLKEAGEDRIRCLPSGKLWLVKFCEFQYPNGISHKCKKHNNIRKSISKNSLPISIGNGYVSDRYSIPNRDISDMSQDKDKDKDKETDTETDVLPKLVSGTSYHGLPEQIAVYAEKIDSLSDSWARSPKEWRENNALQQSIFGRLGSLADVQADDWRTLRWFYLQAESDPELKVTHRRLNLVDDINSHISRARSAWTAAGKPSLAKIKKAAA